MTRLADKFFGNHLRWLAALIIVVLSVQLGGRPALAVEGTVTGGQIDPLPIALPAFIGGSSDAQELGANITSVIANDLGRSGFFNPLPPESYIEQITNFEQEPRFADWRQIQAKALVTGQAVMDGGKLRAEFRLWDVGSQQQLLATQFTTNPKNWRRTAHIIADAIYKQMTGIDGYFDTQVVFIDESGPKNKRVKKLAIMDQDGANIRMLSDGRDLVVTPRFSPNSGEVAYMSYGRGDPRVVIYNVETKQREIVGEFPNVSFAPRFSPDGQSVIMSLLEGGNSNIYVLDLRSRQVGQLTNTPAINTAPSYSPDGSQIVFESDRGGTQQIYTMGADGSNQQRISFGDGRYSTPVWSPQGRLHRFHQDAWRPIRNRGHAAGRLR